MTGTELKTLCTSLNGGASIDDTLLESLVNVGKAVFEGERDWMALRKTDTSLSATTSSTWQTQYSTASITDFLRFRGNFPIRLFDGDNRIEYFRQVPFERRLEYKDINNTFVYDVKNKKFYLNGTLPFAGTLYVNYITNTGDVVLTSNNELDVDGYFPFPSRFHPLLAFYGVGVHKGAVDYDEINKQMLPSNQSVLIALKDALVKWDDALQLNEQEDTDPTGDYGHFRSGAINTHEN